ncbi:hypothetical protein KPH14_003788 [Odynerus spinipes]|uniref:Uncharacterized protein n=1 Tax=Odynerus spinipes TaxID=1348599 RepID=A0AAD9RXB1_9HYME|nr:hypothetical protein KPH14_003788 [Odynerus spinipes]
MAGWTTIICLLVASVTVALVESRAIPAEPVSLMMDAYGNPILFVREKRTPVQPYPQRAMMFTGYYRPVRRSNNGGQATGVYAQGNAVSGETFFGGMHSPNFKNGPEPIQEPEVSSAEAQAAPEPEEHLPENDQQAPVQDDERYVPEEEHHDQHHSQENDQEDNVSKPEAEAPAPAEEPAAPSTEATVNRPKPNPGKKHKKIPVPVDDDEEEDEDDEDEDEPAVPFVPFKGNRRRQGYPHLNNFFPMVFSFPGGSSRAGSPGSPPGAVTAIANSYSTGKGGIANSVATAYGGSPHGKKRRTPPAEE